MTPTQEIKQTWVNNYLSPTLKMVDRLDIRGLRYRIDGASEYVDITFNNGYLKAVNVTGDSEKAIIEDVLRHI